MVQLLIALLILFVIHKTIRWMARTPPETFARLIRSAGGKTGVAQGLFALLSRHGVFGATLSALGSWWLNNARANAARTGSEDFSPAGSGASRRVSYARSELLEMELDLDSGAMRGVFIAGRLSGRPLASFTPEELSQALGGELAADPQGQRLLEAYLDRLFPGWRQAGEGDAHARDAQGAARGDGALSEQLAYEILGLRQGASREEIARAHRALMKKLHPDLGGPADQAARINEARDVLMRRHA